MRDTLTITGPAYWVSAIINGDFSSLTAEERNACETWVEHEQGDDWRIVSTIEDSERFTWSYRLYGGECSGGTVLDYVAIHV